MKKTGLQETQEIVAACLGVKPASSHSDFHCKCVDVEIQSYDNQIWVHAPAHMQRSDGGRGYCLDRCVAEEVMQLWMLGIITTGCCCGHGKEEPFIGVSDDDIPTMKKLGYDVHFNRSRPGDEDSFTPKGSKHLEKFNRKSDSDPRMMLSDK